MLGESSCRWVNERAGTVYRSQILCTNKGLAYLLFSSGESRESWMWNLKYGLLKIIAPTNASVQRGNDWKVFQILTLNSLRISHIF